MDNWKGNGVIKLINENPKEGVLVELGRDKKERIRVGKESCDQNPGANSGREVRMRMDG